MHLKLSNMAYFYLNIIIFLFSTIFCKAQVVKIPKNDFSNNLTFAFFPDWFNYDRLILKYNYTLTNPSSNKFKPLQDYRCHFGLNYSRIFKDKYSLNLGYYHIDYWIMKAITPFTQSGFIWARKISIWSLTSGILLRPKCRNTQIIHFYGGISYDYGMERVHDYLYVFSPGDWEYFGHKHKYDKFGVLAGINYKLYLYKGINLNVFGNYHNNFTTVYFLNFGFGFGYSF
jgi:hypothetical protein